MEQQPIPYNSTEGTQPSSYEPIKPKLIIEEITVNDGSSITITDNQIIAFVGPNNVGKSVTLKDIHSLVTAPHKAKTVVRSVKVRKQGSRNLILEIIKKRLEPRKDTVDQYQLPSYGYYLKDEDIVSRWLAGENLPQFSDLFINFLSTEDRLSVSLAPELISVIDGVPKHLFSIYR